VAAGHEIGNHTIRHPCSANFCWSRDNALEDYTLADMEADILAANDRIKELLGVVPRTFAYPCGQTFVGRGAHCASYVPVVAGRFLAGRGFHGETHNNPALCDLAQLCGSAADGLSFDELRRLADHAAADGGWLVLCSHEVGADGGGQTTGAAVLDRLCEYAADASRGLWVDTVAAVADYVDRCRGSEG
jgi:peptidoglycan/xylan/chitin deacetylase (PgdA/CDA1 family)